ncbi:uncharacterized protein LOC135144979 isoform X2 [Zophobas morio]|uniref:uncharacterized protein LOC135144979 isoform X2 n=1 Tax=Zophobas morio TaxID=2755281 RepID=UPI003082B674
MAEWLLLNVTALLSCLSGLWRQDHVETAFPRSALALGEHDQQIKVYGHVVDSGYLDRENSAVSSLRHWLEQIRELSYRILNNFFSFSFFYEDHFLGIIYSAVSCDFQFTEARHYKYIILHVLHPLFAECSLELWTRSATSVVVQVVQLLFNALECAWHKFNQLSANNNDDNKISEVLYKTLLSENTLIFCKCLSSALVDVTWCSRVYFGLIKALLTGVLVPAAH